MDPTYPPYTYPDSTTSSPRSRDLDYEPNPPTSFDDHSSTAAATKLRFMVSYGGRIQPRSHDNLLSYLGGDTKILSVDRHLKFTSFYSKLAALVSPDTTPFTFKYQLPGEDLDALISVTNDDDLELMMQEFDRVLRGSGKVARLRLFLFTEEKNVNNNGSRFGSASSETGVSPGPVRADSFVDVIPRVISPATPPPPIAMPVPMPVHNNVDFLFGLEKMSGHGPGPVREPDIMNEMNRAQISAQEFHQQLQLQNQQKQSAMYPSKNDDGFLDPYQKPSQIPPGYWQPVEHPPQPPPQHQQFNPQLHQQLLQQQLQQQQLQQQQQQQQQQLQQQPMYMMHAPPQGNNTHHAPPQGNAYNAPPMMRPNQGGYYQVQQQQQQQPVPPPPEQQVYRDQPPPPPSQVSAGYVQQQVAYDSATGRQVFYTAAQQGGVIAPPYPGMSAAAAAVVVSGGGGDMRRGSGDGKIVHKVVTAASPAAV